MSERLQISKQPATAVRGSVTSAPARVLQRKCACEGPRAAGDECDDCKRKKVALQRYATDPYDTGDIPPIVHDLLRSPSQPLDLATRAFFEPRFGHDFSKVRVHTGARAAESAKAVHARAYTVGQNVVFASGQFSTQSSEGRKLLAHELTHTVQQSRGTGGPTPGTAQEREADAAAEAATAGSPRIPVGVSSQKGIARQSDDAGVSAAAGEFTDQDAASCSSLYLQKLCVFIIGGLNGDRSGVERPEEMKGYNATCRKESGYTGDDVGLSDQEKVKLRSPVCERGDTESARRRARDARIADALARSAKFMPGAIGDRLVSIITDPVFLVSLAVAVGIYLALWLAPEPVFTKIAAAATTIAILATGAFSVSTIINLARAWSDLDNEAGSAESPEQIERAAEHFGKRIGAVEADLIVFLASLLLGGRVPGPKQFPPAGEALAKAEQALASTSQGAVVIQGPWGRLRATAPAAEAGPVTSGNLALKYEPAPVAGPVPEVAPPPPEAAPAPAAAAKPAAPGKTVVPVTPVVPGVRGAPEEKERPPFVLLLPRQKESHLLQHRRWLGVLQSDPNYERGNPPQLDNWHRALRIGGSNPIPTSVYERGHALGLTGEDGERRIRVPDWPAAECASFAMQVDHIVELQLTPPSMRDEFDSVSNWELLDAASNQGSGSLLRSNIAKERARQVAFDPSAANRVLRFDQVELDGGTPGERWTVEEIQKGEQLDAYEKCH
jgi:hypothetical protein